MDTRDLPLQHQLYTREQSSEMDRATIDDFGIDGFTLMEIAGNKAADFIQENHPKPDHALVFAGKGNNGGDALVVGRLLHQYGHKITVVFVGGIETLSPDCMTNYELIKALQEKSPHQIDIQTEYDRSKLPNDAGIIVDGMFGTGLNADMVGDYEDAAYWMNDQHHAKIYSMDIPSGIHANTGNFLGCAIKASCTLSFGSRKLGSYLNEGLTHCGEVEFFNLPFPQHLRESNHSLFSELWLETEEKKSQRSHKYSEGMIYIIGGSSGLTGAAVLTAQSAWATGIGAVTIITPKGLLDIYEKHLVEIIKKPIGDPADSHFSTKHLDDVNKVLSEKSGLLIIGPGLGREPETISFVQQLLSEYEGKAVIDADALYAMAESSDIKKPDSAEWILTPHPGELGSFFDESPYPDDYHRLERTGELSKRLGAHVLSKGYPTILGTTSKDFYLTDYDNRIFARAGFGDVLAGKIGAYWLGEKKVEYAAGKALIDGYKKATEHLSNTGEKPSPLDVV